MIIVRAPLRVSLGGGGTDLPGYFEKNNGFVVSAAINKFITIVINENLKNRFEIKYSEYENVKKIDNIKHNIIRECLKNQIKPEEIEYIPDDMITGSEPNALHAFFKRCGKHLMEVNKVNPIPSQVKK